MFPMLRAFIFTALCAAMVPFSLLAQVATTTSESAQQQLPELTLNVTPPHPRAFSVVSIEAENYIIDLNAADFVWKVNGVVRQKGMGLKTLSLTLGGLGKTTTITATAVTPDGRAFEKEVSLTPADVYLLWQSNAYTPPFYRGKALFPYQGTILVAAVPEFVDKTGKKTPDRDLIYTWKEDDTVIGDASGYGKNLFLVQGTIPIRAKTISVEAATADGTLVANTSVFLEPVSPRIVFYENSPLYGLLFNRALSDTVSLPGDEMKLEAAPYYIETPTRKYKDISYTWQVNGEEFTGGEPSLVVRRASGKSGTSNLALSVQSASRPFQAARSSLRVILPEFFGDLFIGETSRNAP